MLELGGKDPMLVLDDADTEIAAQGAVWGAFVNAGQACLSVERCFVHRSRYESFLDPAFVRPDNCGWEMVWILRLMSGP